MMTPGGRPRVPSRWAEALLVGLLAAVAFLPGVFGEFVHWDDDHNFLFNLAYRGLGWAQIAWMFTTAHLGPYAPLAWVTLGADYVLWGMRPLGYHLTSLALHAANAVLFLWVARRLLAAALPGIGSDAALRIGAVGAALLFAVHPLRVESVVWITERRDVVSGLFYLLAVLAYLRYVEAERESRPRRRRWYAVCLGLFTAGLLSKSIVVSLPVVLLIVDVYPLRRLGGPVGWASAGARRIYVEKIPFVLLSGAGSVVAFLALLDLGNMPAVATLGLVTRAAISWHGLAFYLWKTIWPVGLSPLYEIPLVVDPMAARFLLSGLVVLGLTTLAVLARRACPAFTAAWCCYVVSVAPVLGIFQNGPQIAADRYTYLGCLGWALLAGACLTWCAGVWFADSRRRPWAGLLLGAGTAVVVVLVALTAWQSLVWHDSSALWTHALTVDAGSPRAHVGLGATYLREGEIEAARRHFAEAVRLDPVLPEGLMGLAVVESFSGDGDQAVAHARKAASHMPGRAAYRHQLGVILRHQGRREEALAELVLAARLDPSTPVYRYAVAVALAEQGRLPEAVASLEAGRRLLRRMGQSDPEADRAEARVYETVDLDRAVAAWERYLGAMSALASPTRIDVSKMVEGVDAVQQLRARRNDAVAER
jgi:tetratricopeptide (TPR) repeat protein